MPPSGLLIIGGSGFVGSHVVQLAIQNNLSAAYTYCSHPLPIDAPAYHVDIGQGEDLEKCIRETQPKAIIYSAVTQTWLDERLQTEISLTGVERVIAALQKQNSPARLIYVSTNSVFSGIDGPYPETYPPDTPISGRINTGFMALGGRWVNRLRWKNGRTRLWPAPLTSKAGPYRVN